MPTLRLLWSRACFVFTYSKEFLRFLYDEVALHLLGASRLPILLIAAIFIGLALASPAQVTHIIQDEWSKTNFVFKILFFAPLILAGSLHLVFLSRSATPPGPADGFIAGFPLAAMALLILRATGSNFIVCLMALTIGFFCFRQVIRLFNLSPEGKLAEVAAILVLLIWIVVTVLVIASPITVPTTLGLNVVTIGLSMIGLAIGLFVVWPRWMTSYALICLAAAYFSPPQAPVHRGQEAHFGASRSVETALREWLDARADIQAYKNAGRPYPIIISSAEGGGIYAAAHAYMALSAIQELCPSFSDHLFAVVGVSGGSVGNLWFQSKLPEKKPATLLPCHEPSKNIDISPLRTDLLSPALANLLIGQVADFFVPWIQILPDGGQTLADAVASAVPDNQLVTGPLGKSWSANSSRPLLIFLATDVNRGNRFVMSPLEGEVAHNAELFPGGDLPSNQAAVISARFPWLTSTARLQVSTEDFRNLADGGYFENSGADTVIDLLENIMSLGKKCSTEDEFEDPQGTRCKCPIIVERVFAKNVKWNGCEEHVFFAYVPIIGSEDGIPGYTYKSTPRPSQSYFLDPIKTMLKARTTRGQLALSRARRVLIRVDPDRVQGTNVHGGYFSHEMPIEELDLPLGWRLSDKAIERMRLLIVPTAKCGFLPGGEFFDDDMYLTDDDKWREKWIASAKKNEGLRAPEEEKNLTQDRPPTAPVPGIEAVPVPGIEAVPVDENRSAVAQEDNACNMLLLAWLFNPEGKKAYYGIPSWGHP